MYAKLKTIQLLFNFHICLQEQPYQVWNAGKCIMHNYETQNKDLVIGI